MIKNKTCSKCGVEKPLDEFHRASRSKDGRQRNKALGNMEDNSTRLEAAAAYLRAAA